MTDRQHCVSKAMTKMARIVLLSVLTVTVTTTACRKKAKPEAPQTAMPTQPLFMVDSAPSPTALLKLLTDALTAYEELHGGTPQDLSQLVEKRVLDRMPVAPPGRKFSIDSTKHIVVLVNQ